MKKTGFLYDDRYKLHDTGPYHPEVPNRLQAIYQGIKDGGLLKWLVQIDATRAKREWIEMVHDPKYLKRFEEACNAGKPELDYTDNQMCPETYEIAMLAVGGIIRTIDMMMEGKIDNAFCAVRPPGHHAECDRAMGFCYFNNIAIAARYLQKQWKIDKVGIIDFDVHHGNGTQHLFEEDDSVFYYSIHQHPSFAFPGTGREFEQGRGQGHTYTKNTPVMPGHGDEEYQRLIKRDMLPAFESFKPEVLLISAGFDAHMDDEMSDINLTEQGFIWITRQIVNIADKYCKGRLISVLEGGYCLERLPQLARDHVTILLGDIQDDNE